MATPTLCFLDACEALVKRLASHKWSLGYAPELMKAQPLLESTNTSVANMHPFIKSLAIWLERLISQRHICTAKMILWLNSSSFTQA